MNIQRTRMQGDGVLAAVARSAANCKRMFLHATLLQNVERERTSSRSRRRTNSYPHTLAEVIVLRC